MYSNSPDYFKIFLQLLGAILLIALIFVAWEVRNWLNSKNDTNGVKNPTQIEEVTLLNKNDGKVVSAIRPITPDKKEPIEESNNFGPRSIFGDEPIKPEPVIDDVSITDITEKTEGVSTVMDTVSSELEKTENDIDRLSTEANIPSDSNAKMLSEVTPDIDVTGVDSDENAVAVDVKPDAIMPEEGNESVVDDSVISKITPVEGEAETPNTKVLAKERLDDNELDQAITEPDMVAPKGIDSLVESSMAHIKLEEEKNYIRQVAQSEKPPSEAGRSKEALANSEKQKTQSSKNASVDVYNKIKITTDSATGNGIQNQISALVNSSMTKDKPPAKVVEVVVETNTSEKPKQVATKDDSGKADNYAADLEKEVKTRQNEMRTIVVREGDTLGRISIRAYGKSHLYLKIYKANPQILANPHRLKIGQVLRVPE